MLVQHLALLDSAISKTMTQRPLPSKSRLLARMALSFGLPMYIFTCGMLWKLGGLTVPTAFGLAVVCAPCSFGFAAAMVAILEKKYGPFKD
jgi:hypothetical protein